MLKHQYKMWIIVLLVIVSIVSVSFNIWMRNTRDQHISMDQCIDMVNDAKNKTPLSVDSANNLAGILQDVLDNIDASANNFITEMIETR